MRVDPNLFAKACDSSYCPGSASQCTALRKLHSADNTTKPLTALVIDDLVNVMCRCVRLDERCQCGVQSTEMVCSCEKS